MTGPSYTPGGVVDYKFANYKFKRHIEVNTYTFNVAPLVVFKTCASKVIVGDLARSYTYIVYIAVPCVTYESIALHIYMTCTKTAYVKWTYLRALHAFQDTPPSQSLC